MRNDIWLENRLEYIFRKYFADLTATNQIHIKFGRNSYRQLGCIKNQSKSRIKHIRENSPTLIVISGFFRDEIVPDFVIDGIIAHELSHYAHGFNSPLPQKHRNPHRGGVIKKELKDRGIVDLEIKQKSWIKENWQKYVSDRLPKRKQQRQVIIRFR